MERGGKKPERKERFEMVLAGASSLNFEGAKSSVFTTRSSTKCDGKYSCGGALMFRT